MVDRDGRRYVVGLIGAGIETSMSPLLHEREADEQGLSYVYQLIDIDALQLVAEDVGALVSEARRMGFRGLNITHPCKQAVVKYLDELSPDAAALGAVNTVVFGTAGDAVGHNTDWSGFAEGFVRGLPGAPSRDIVLLGAGGAGAAVAHAMLVLGAERITVVDVAPERAKSLAAALNTRAGGRAGSLVPDVPENISARLRGADGLINATPVGMTHHPGLPVPADLLRPDLWVADIVYRPLQTELLRHARERGCRTLDGGGMVVFQAAESMRLFTGRAPDVDRMYRHFVALTGTRAVDHA
jgi:shikimate dehydrogenase